MQVLLNIAATGGLSGTVATMRDPNGRLSCWNARREIVLFMAGGSFGLAWRPTLRS